MAAQCHATMSTDSSVGTYDNLFDDDSGILGATCFRPDVQQDATSNKCLLHNPTSSCNSSSFSSSCSCCSLCRPPVISEADEEADDEYNVMCRPANAAAFRFPRSDTQTKTHSASLPRGAVDSFKRPGSSLCDVNCIGLSQCSSPFKRPFRVPIKFIDVPRSCINPSALAKVEQKAVPIDGNDYLSTGFLPEDVFCHIANFSSVASLLRLRECNRKLRTAASRNNAGWQHHTESLWSSKITVCQMARGLLAESNKAGRDATKTHACAAMEAYKISVTDAATRQEISLEELCFDGSRDEAGISWSFRFKTSAGRDWISWDPWWNRHEARKLVFLRDGTVLQTHPRGKGSSIRNHNGTALYDVFSERREGRDGGGAPAPRIEMKWRFVRCPLDLDPRPPGAYIRVSVAGRDVPTYVVRRAPDGNWGFVLESCWGVYASVALDPRVPAATWPGSGGRRRRRPWQGHRWAHAEESDGESGNEDGVAQEPLRNVHRRIDLFVDQASTIRDGYGQWREALLYNIGAATLPDGNDGFEFENAWRNAIRENRPF